MMLDDPPFPSDLMWVSNLRYSALMGS